jgi:hypothetical protein
MKTPLIYDVNLLPENKWEIRKHGSPKPIKIYTYFDTYAKDLTYIIVNHNCEIHIYNKDGKIDRVITST